MQTFLEFLSRNRATVKKVQRILVPKRPETCSEEHVSLEVDDCKIYSSLVPTWSSATTLHKFITPFVERPISPFEIHSTVVWSTTEVPDYKPLNEPIRVDPDTYSYDILGGCWVLRYEHPKAHEQWNLAKKLGATFTFDKYLPHVTLSYEPGEGFDFTDIPLPRFPIVFSREVIQK